MNTAAPTFTDLQPVKKGMFASSNRLNDHVWLNMPLPSGSFERLRAFVQEHCHRRMTTADWLRLLQQAIMLHKARCLVIDSCIAGELNSASSPRSKVDSILCVEVMEIAASLGLSESEFYEIVEDTHGQRERLGLTTLQIEL